MAGWWSKVLRNLWEGKNLKKAEKKRSEEIDTLKNSAAKAVEVLVDLLESDEVKPELKKACAESILDRVYGKAAVVKEEKALDKIELSANLKKYAK